MICNGFTCRKIMVQSVYILNILTGQYVFMPLDAFEKQCIVYTLQYISRSSQRVFLIAATLGQCVYSGSVCSAVTLCNSKYLYNAICRSINR